MATEPEGGSLTFEVKDSGERREFESGMVRDTTEGKINWLLIRPGPMLRRWASHLSKAAAKYDNTRKPGEPRNWQLAEGLAEYERFQESAARHFGQWLAGERDEDHAAAVFFNINGAEYVLEKLETPTTESPYENITVHLEAAQVISEIVRRATCPAVSPSAYACELAAGHEGAHYVQLNGDDAVEWDVSGERDV